MAERDERREAAVKHEALMKGAFAAETRGTVEAAVVYEDGEAAKLELPEAPFEATETIVTSAFAPEALYRFGKGHCVVVDPASFTRPGGAYEDGAFGPEQILCADSNLYQVLQGVKSAYHNQNRGAQSGQLYTSRALYLPDVVFSRGGSIRKVDVLAIAEPLRARALENHRSERECDLALADRVNALLTIAAANDCETLVVGAFGCGRLGYEPASVTALFKEWLEAHPGTIGRVVFAVPRAAFDAFDAAFGQPAEESPAPTAATTAAEVDDDSDDFDWTQVELPEGITIR